MKDIEIITNNSNILEVFRTFKVLDEVPIEAHPEFYRFTEIVYNYLKIQKLKDTQLKINFDESS